MTEHFFQSEKLILLYSIFGAILLVFSLFFLQHISRFIVLTLLIVGIVCYYLEEVSLFDALLGFGENINLLSLFLLIPLIGTFMSSAGYLTALKEMVQEKERKGNQHPYRLSFFLTATIGVLLNFGSMPIVKRIAEESLSAYRDQKLTLTIMRAFAFGMFWSPYFVNVGLVLVLFNLSWLDISGYGFILGLIYLLVCWLMFRKISFPDDPIIEHTHLEKTYLSQQSLVPLLSFSFTLITLSFLLDYLLEVNMLTIVSILAIILPICWALGTKVISSYIHDVSEQVQSSFFRLKNEIAIFISAGFFGKAISETEIGATISEMLFQSSFGSVYLLSFSIVILAIILAQIGIHPIIIVIGIGSALSPEKFGVSPEYLAMLLLVAWTLATQLSPFSGQVLMASRLMGKPPKMLIIQNIPFVLLLSIILISTIFGLHWFKLL
ncbi:hypothetical protein [Halalkalibacter nanhaiisediminis]|uniref:Uncharacterized protein n=1 Tax=Halalkalibacter nanhaiisediminis TaxID=688079 RepID=A0A562QQZ2_9BACI|nr:hypothetical protein [Halalkalibacter nanhaiisediminis]TWI59127.1 hypothetical protein IQ10_00839 [Halalkalibacter nanhaiisediminis]